MDEIEKCFREHWDEFVKKISRRCVNPSDAEDVVSEAFKRAIMYRQSYKPEKQAIHIWIFTIVLNSYHDYIADLFKRGMTVQVNDAHIEGYERDFGDGVLAEQILGEINSMPEGQAKDCLGMYYGLGMTPREIALVSPVNAKFIRNTVYRFKSMLVEKLKLGEWVADEKGVTS